MIKIKLTNWNIGRNNHVFRTFLMYAEQFLDIGVQFVADGSYDIEFIGMADFINRKLPLDASIKYGIDNLKNKTGTYCLFDGSDSTSLLGAYEVFVNSSAKYLYKTALLKRENYNVPSAFNKWFFGAGSDIDIAYNISETIFDKIKLTGWNLGYYNNYSDYININANKPIDVCAIYQGVHEENRDHLVRNDVYYTKHRTSAWEKIQLLNSVTYEIEKRPFHEFVNIMMQSKCTLSPYGMGEICFRDFEAIKFGSVLLKPSMDRIITYPNIYIPWETYIPCNLDWSDLQEKIDWIKNHPVECNDIIYNARKIYMNTYTIENLLLYWYNQLITFKGIQ
jgi:hypothetical protein